MGRGAKGVNDLLHPHERVFGNTSYERARARARAHAMYLSHADPRLCQATIAHSCLQKGAIN
jgi:hypothetical protein